MTKKIAIISCGEIPKSRLVILKSRAIREFGNDVEFNVITMSKEKLTTAERILNDHLWMGTKPSESQQTILSAMEEYKDLHTAPLQARIYELEDFKKDAVDKIFELKLELENQKSVNEDLKQYIFSCKTDKENQVDVDIQFLKEMKDRLNKSLSDPTQTEYLHNMISDWINQLEKEQAKEALKGETKR